MWGFLLAFAEESTSDNIFKELPASDASYAGQKKSFRLGQPCVCQLCRNPCAAFHVY